MKEGIQRKIICWMTKSDENRLKMHNLPVTFVHSEEECASIITPEDFVLCSLQFAEDCIDKMESFVRGFPKVTFHMFGIYDGPLTKGIRIFNEPNVDDDFGAYIVEDMIKILAK